MTPRPRARVSARQRWPAILALVAIGAACNPDITSTATFDPGASTGSSPGASGPEVSGLPPGTSPGSSPQITSPPPATVAPTVKPFVTETYQYSDVLKVVVNSLAARTAPKRTAALVRGYDTSGPAPVDKGLVRLDKGDFVSVQLGPLRIGQTVWYLVWPSDTGALHDAAIGWYSGSPASTGSGPAWVAASVGTDVYMKFQRRPDLAEIESYLPIGVNATGTGTYVSAPQARHDFWLFDWAAAAPTQGTSCDVKVTLVPADPGFAPKIALSTSTDTSKVGPLDGATVQAPWLPAPADSWTTFTLNVTGTCRWAIRLTRLDHD